MKEPVFKISTEFGLIVTPLKPRQIHEDQVTHDFVDVGNNRTKLDFNRIIFLKNYSILQSQGDWFGLYVPLPYRNKTEKMKENKLA